MRRDLPWPGILTGCVLAFLIGCSSQAVPDTAGDAGGATDAIFVDGCRVGLPLQSTPCFTCEPLPPDSHNVGCGAPLPTLWGWDGSGIADGVVYPLGCTVYLPVENPFYPGGPQFCSCQTVTDGPPPTWLCPI